MNRRISLTPLLVGFFALLSFYQAVAAELTNFTHSKNGIVLERSDTVSVTINALGYGSVEVLYQQADELPLPGMAVAEEVLKNSQTMPTSLIEKSDHILFIAGDVTVQIDKNPFRLHFLKDDKVRVAEATGGFFYNTIRGLRFALNDTERLYGGGQRVMGMDRRGKRMPLYNRASYGYTTDETDQMYYGFPAVMSSEHYAIMFDNTATGNLDIGHTEANILQFDAVGGRLAYIVSLADNLPDLVQRVVSVTGKQPLPPRWALGNFASRFGYRSEAQTREVVALYNKYEIPLDAVVLDLFWFGPDIKGHMGNLDWDRNTFPTAEKMLADFAQQDIQTVVITEPFILTTSTEFESAKANQALAVNADGETRRFDFYFGNTGIVDVFNEQGQDWFWQYYQRLAEQGVSGWWGDLGEPEVHPYDAIHNWNGVTATAEEVHNGYGHKWAQMVYERTLQLKPDERPLVLMRSGFLGSQRYGMIPWTGDVSRSWGGFKPQVELALQMSLFGLAYIHSDLGGFAGGEEFDAELYLRWLQAGTFTPVYRPHAQEHIPPEPVFHDSKTRDIAKSYIQLRYDMLPYNYSLAYENSLTGTPLMRPLAFLDADKYFAHTDSYLWGDSLLVQPVTDPGVKRVKVALPAGVWFAFFGDKKYVGGTTVDFALDMETMPVFVKAGAFVPMQPGMTRLAQASNRDLVMHYWADMSVKLAEYTMYEDDGNNPNAIADKQYLQLDFSAAHNQGQVVLTMAPSGSYAGMAPARSISWIVHGIHESPSLVGREDGEPLSWEWDASSNRLLITTVLDHRKSVRLLISE